MILLPVHKFDESNYAVPDETLLLFETEDSVRSLSHFMSFTFTVAGLLISCLSVNLSLQARKAASLLGCKVEPTCEGFRFCSYHKSFHPSSRFEVGRLADLSLFELDCCALLASAMLLSELWLTRSL